MENPAMDDCQASERTIIPCCIHLRTKTQYYMPDELAAGPGFIKLTTTGTYWCNRTSRSFGPDDSPSTPHSCQSGRGCYERPAYP
jgi:hypothetical protein